MKTLKSNLMQTLFIIPFIVLLLTNACAPSGNNSTADASIHAGSVAAKPKMVIYTAVLTDLLELVKQHNEAQTDLYKKENPTFIFCIGDGSLFCHPQRNWGRLPMERTLAILTPFAYQERYFQCR